MLEAADDHVPKGRIETLADGVFAIAMTLLAFNLQPPAVSIRDNWDLQAALLAMLPLSTAVLGRYKDYQAAIVLYSGNLLLVGSVNARRDVHAVRAR